MWREFRDLKFKVWILVLNILYHWRFWNSLSLTFLALLLPRHQESSSSPCLTPVIAVMWWLHHNYFQHDQSNHMPLCLPGDSIWLSFFQSERHGLCSDQLLASFAIFLKDKNVLDWHGPCSTATCFLSLKHKMRAANLSAACFVSVKEKQKIWTATGEVDGSGTSSGITQGGVICFPCDSCHSMPVLTVPLQVHSSMLKGTEYSSF